MSDVLRNDGLRTKEDIYDTGENWFKLAEIYLPVHRIHVEIEWEKYPIRDWDRNIH